MNIIPMTEAHLDFAVQMVIDEGWSSETREVYQDFLAYDPEGCFVAEVDGEPAGMVVAIKYRRQGFLGELIVAPGQRGHGIGHALFQQALSYLGQANLESIALDADAPGIPIYEQAGFVKRCLSRRFYGRLYNRRLSGRQPGGTVGKDNLRAYQTLYQRAIFRPAAPTDLAAICSLDARLFGDDRSFFLQRMFEHHPELCYVAEMENEYTALGNELAGYAMARPGHGLLTIGPWAALPTLIEPETLVKRIAARHPGQRLRIGVLDTNQNAVELLRSLPGLIEGEPSWRMTLGEDEGPGAHPCLFAIGSAAKG